ncbi:hypothetical protein HOO68_03295 [Candidatus Gracilibacteria bacterium]|nr:hypothetical protein [Candidatus Gracilibacteria bacterium]
MTHEISSTSPEALHHGGETLSQWHNQAPFKQTKIASAIHLVLNPKTHLVDQADNLPDVERILGVKGMGPSLLLGVKSLIGKTLSFNGSYVLVVETGTKIPVQVATNEDRFAVAA